MTKHAHIMKTSLITWVGVISLFCKISDKMQFLLLDGKLIHLVTVKLNLVCLVKWDLMDGFLQEWTIKIEIKEIMIKL